MKTLETSGVTDGEAIYIASRQFIQCNFIYRLFTII
jgi:hypothetical protein